eukprot:3575614-Amphidinium_carterae.1
MALQQPLKSTNSLTQRGKSFGVPLQKDERLRFALRRPIQCFKWGEYALQPGTDYEYTLFAIHGEPEATAAVQGLRGTRSNAVKEPSVSLVAPGCLCVIAHTSKTDTQTASDFMKVNNPNLK